MALIDAPKIAIDAQFRVVPTRVSLTPVKKLGADMHGTPFGNDEIAVSVILQV